MQEISDVRVNEKAAELIAAFKEKKMTFGTAESCTGGLISKSITDIPGASEIFLGSVVSYANSVKSGVLGVSERSLLSVGAVSADVAMQMALGARDALGVDVAVSVTGIAGPDGGTEEKPVGLVYIAVCFSDDRVICEKCNFSGDRESIRKQTAVYAMDMAIKTVL